MRDICSLRNFLWIYTFNICTNVKW